MISEVELKDIICSKFPNSIVEVKDLVGDMNHYEVRMKSPKFEGLSRVEQHRLFNEEMADYVGTKIHALSLKILR
jgi:stress-induced morphogen